MDLIYTNSDLVDQGVLQDCMLDLAFGADENDFELEVPAEGVTLEAGALLYIEGTEYGGMVDGMRYTSADGVKRYTGRTWHGILNSKVIQPDAGSDYYTVSGDANAVLAVVLQRLSLSALFVAADGSSGLSVSYQFNRYCGGYDGLRAMLESAGGKLRMEVLGTGRVQLSAVPVVRYVKENEWDSDRMTIDATQLWHPVNHLICLGKGDLRQRQVVHLYADANGDLSTTQTSTGLAERVAVYDYANAESLESLTANGMAKLAEYQAGDSCKASLADSETVYDIGDVVGVCDAVTGLSVETTITKKIVTISGGVVTVSNKSGSE
mgnify:FL=1